MILRVIKQNKRKITHQIVMSDLYTIIFVFEVIRREEEWEKKLVEKVRLYQDFYANYVLGDSGFSAMPQLIFICEDEKHMAESFKTIVTNGIEIPPLSLRLSLSLMHLVCL